MSVYLFILGIVIVATAWILGFLALHSRRRLPRDVLFASLAAFTAVHVVVLGRELALVDASWEPFGFAALVLGHASLAAFAVLFLHGEPTSRRLPALLAIAGPGLLIAALGGPNGWRVADTFQPAVDVGHVAVNMYLIACLAVALAESLAVYRRSVLRRREALLLVAGFVALVVGGPVYAFELSVLGFAGLAGTNLAMPVAGALFALALVLANPLPFRGTAAREPPWTPWSIPAGVLLLEEIRPTYAEAAFHAAADGKPSLAILGGPAGKVSGVQGADIARLPSGDRCASVLQATASEFLARTSNGVVLVHDVSYPVLHSGLPATVEALARTIGAVPREATLIVSLTKLTPDERQALRGVQGTYLAPPDLETELAKVLRGHLGAVEEPLGRAAQALGKRVSDLSLGDLPRLRDAVLDSFHRMRDSTDEAARAGWARVSEGLAKDLDALWRTPPTERRPRAVVGQDSGLTVVRAADVVAAVPTPPSRAAGPIGPAVRDAFLGTLGSAGETVYRRVVGRMRKDPDALGPEDLPRVAALADEAVADLSGAIDGESAKKDLVERARRLRATLDTLAQEVTA